MKWIFYLIRKVIYLMSYLFPRQKNKIVFGSYRNLFNDNAKYLYLAWQNHPTLIPIWISADKKVITTLQSQGKQAYLRYSLLGIWHALTAKCYCYNSYIGDINQYFAAGATKINLWHGSPLKKIEFDIDHGPMASIYHAKTRLSRLMKSIKYHQQYVKPNIMLSPSKLFDDIYSSSFNINKKSLIRANYPRTEIKDNSANNTGIEYSHYNKVILYAPTWRDSKSTDNPYTSAFNWPQLSKHLVNHNQLLILKLHPNERHLSQDFNQFENIINISDIDDIYPILTHIDIMVSDYSSLVFDALLYNIKLIFYPFDQQNYQLNCRQSYPYVAELPEIGLTVQNMAEFIGAIEEKENKQILANKKALKQQLWQGQQTANKCLESIILFY
ncbi:CDP-glycerol glycerophosphotransferase family protein [Shewanella marina]|uniref:CDP-glycerol glycerophosphotransferase family protein n=1 Tax=Shewanella marina TaxID=487319 RepID=UPI000471EF5D|nr:CDP-glycerol glycerophosphotransferase family protein [Shewanella marina]